MGKLDGFYGSLDPAGQAMLGTILEGRNRAIRVGTALGPGPTGTRRRVARVQGRKLRGRMTWEVDSGAGRGGHLGISIKGQVVSCTWRCTWRQDR